MTSSLENEARYDLNAVTFICLHNVSADKRHESEEWQEVIDCFKETAAAELVIWCSADVGENHFYIFEAMPAYHLEPTSQATNEQETTHS